MPVPLARMDVADVITGDASRLLAPLLERTLLADSSLHAAHTRGELRVLDVQFPISGKLAQVTVRTQVVRACEFGMADDGQNGFGAQPAVAGLLAASTKQSPLIGRRAGKPQQFGQSRGTGLVHRRTHRPFHGLQVQPSALAPTAEQNAYQPVYFTCDFFMNRNNRFFSSGVQVVSTGSTGRC